MSGIHGETTKPTDKNMHHIKAIMISSQSATAEIQNILNLCCRGLAADHDGLYMMHIFVCRFGRFAMDPAHSLQLYKNYISQNYQNVKAKMICKSSALLQNNKNDAEVYSSSNQYPGNNNIQHNHNRLDPR